MKHPIRLNQQEALAVLAAPPTPGQGVMGRPTADALQRAGYVEVTSYILGNRAAVRLTVEGRDYLDREVPEPPASEVEPEWAEQHDKVLAARLRFRVASDNYTATGPGAAALREALGLVDVLAETCLKMIDRMEKKP